MGRLAPLFTQIRVFAIAAGLVLAASTAMAETATEHGTDATGHAAKNWSPDRQAVRGSKASRKACTRPSMAAACPSSTR